MTRDSVVLLVTLGVVGLPIIAVYLKFGIRGLAYLKLLMVRTVYRRRVRERRKMGL